MRYQLQSFALAAVFVAGTGGLALAQNMNDGNQTWVQPGHWQRGQFGYAPVYQSPYANYDWRAAPYYGYGNGYRTGYYSNQGY